MATDKSLDFEVLNINKCMGFTTRHIEEVVLPEDYFEEKLSDTISQDETKIVEIKPLPIYKPPNMDAAKPAAPIEPLVISPLPRVPPVAQDKPINNKTEDFVKIKSLYSLVNRKDDNTS
jgi:hypothetical protein